MSTEHICAPHSKVDAIDIVSTNMKYAFLDNNDFPKLVENIDGTFMTPMYINLYGENEMLIGQEAKEMLHIDPDNTFSHFSQQINSDVVLCQFCGQKFTPIDALSFVIKKVHDDAKLMGINVSSNVVYTCPPYMEQKAQIRLETAIEKAGLVVSGVVFEPIAVAEYYMKEMSSEKHLMEQPTPYNILIYDLGESAFSASVIQLKSGDARIVSADGNCNLGGKDWTARLMQFFQEQYRDKTGFDEDFDETDIDGFIYRTERIKLVLSAKKMCLECSMLMAIRQD